jgi:S1-C subfamily serine protease
VAIDGATVESQQDVARIMNQHRAGDTVTVTVYRGKQKMDVRVTLGEAREQA